MKINYKITLLLIPLMCFNYMLVTAQNVGINTVAPDASAILDITHTNRGLLIPRLQLVASNNPAPVIAPALSLLVFNTATAGVPPNEVIPGYYYWDGAKWVGISAGNAWQLLGNAGTTAGINFIGTTDAQDVVIKTNNINRMQLTQKGRIILNNPSGSNFVGDNGNETNTGQFNNAFGGSCLKLLTTGNHNNAFGQAALSMNTIGTGNTAMGHGSLTANISGNYNAAYGFSSLQSNTTGSYNVAIGMWSLKTNTTGSGNIANGYNALASNTTGAYNIANGYNSLANNTTGGNNTANGHNSLANNTTGNGNVANGNDALSANTTGTSNVANGDHSLVHNTTGSYNAANGPYALQFNTAGDGNVGNGYQALNGTTIGNYNNANGYNSGITNTIGNYNTYLGSGADATANNFDKATAIGYNAKVGASNSLVLGGTGADAVNVGIGTTTPTERLQVQGNLYVSGMVYNPSDRRYKEHITTIPNALANVIKLRGVTYTIKNEFKNKGLGTGIQVGVIAQELEQVYPQLVQTDANGYKAVDYAKLCPILIEAIKELKTQNEALKTVHTEQMHMLYTRIKALEKKQ
jgi:hypothetical protein